MKHVALEDLQRAEALGSADAALPGVAPVSLSRRARLERWASLLDAHDGGVRPFYGLEHLPRAERHAVRADDSPLSVAFADSMLRAHGLNGDNVGAAMVFFELSDRQMHRLFCDCHYAGKMTAGGVAAQLRAIAESKPIGERLGALWRKVFG